MGLSLTELIELEFQTLTFLAEIYTGGQHSRVSTAEKAEDLNGLAEIGSFAT